MALFAVGALPADGHHEDDSSSVCHGDDFLAEGSERTLSELDRLLNEHFEVTAGNMIGPGRPRQTRYLTRIIGYTEDIPEHGGPGFFWTADPKHVDFLVQWTKKRSGKPAVTPGTKATGMGARDSLELLSRSLAREVAGAGGAVLYLSSDRPDTIFASKTAMQHVSKPNVLMNARLQRLGRYYEGKPVMVWCYPLQELPNGIRVDGDGDWAPTTELLRRSTSGGAVRYGLHTWDCYSVTQATIALSSAESEFYATGSATARGLQCKVYLSETERPCELDVYSDSTAGRGMCQRTGVGKVRHLELRFLWIQERLRLKAFRLNKETTEEMTADILTKYCEWPKIEQHCATLNLRFPVEGLSSLMLAGFLVHCANADVEAVSGEASLDTVNPVTDSQVWQCILVVWLVLLFAMLMSFGLDCDCGWFSVVCCARFGHHGESQSFGSVPDAVSSALETEPWMPMRDVTEHKRETERARRGLLSTLHEDIETSCRMGGLHIGRSKRVSFDGTLSIERQARMVQRLRNEAAAGGLAVQVEFGNLEPRSTSWVERPSRRHESASNIEVTRPEKASKWIKLTERKCLEQRDRAD